MQRQGFHKNKTTKPNQKRKKMKINKFPNTQNFQTTSDIESEILLRDKVFRIVRNIT